MSEGLTRLVNMQHHENIMNGILRMIFAIGFTFAAVQPARAQSISRSLAESTVSDAGRVLRGMTVRGGQLIPNAVLRRAVAIGVFPDVKKAGLVFGATLGRGVIVAKRADGSWSGPAFYRMAGASYGLQAGVQSADIVLIIVSRRGLRGFLGTKVTLGNDSAVAAGPKGAKGSLFKIGNADVLTYTKVRGLFAGASLQGATITPAGRMTRAYYRKGVSTRQVLLSLNRRMVPAGGRRLTAGLASGSGGGLLMAIQTGLARKGFYKGRADGLIGPKTRSAIRVYQKAQGLRVTGAPSLSLLRHIRGR